MLYEVLLTATEHSIKIWWLDFLRFLVSVPCSHVSLDFPLLLCLPILSCLIFYAIPGSVSLVQSPDSQHSGPCVDSSYSQGLSPAPSHAHTFLLLGMQQNPSHCSCQATAGLPCTPTRIHFAGCLFCSQVCQPPHCSFIYFLPHRLQHLLVF